MAYIRTGAQILERLRRDIKTGSNVGRYGDEPLANAWEEAWRETWEDLTAGDYGIGLARTDLTGSGASLPLPADFLYALSIARRRSPSSPWVAGVLSSDKMTIALSLDSSTTLGQWYYQIMTSAAGETLEVVPDMTASDTVRLSYVPQAPSLGDPANQIAWQAASINVLAEAVYQHVVARARVKAVSREEQSEYQRALAESAQGMQRYLAHRRTRTMAAGVGANRAASTRACWLGYD